MVSYISLMVCSMSKRWSISTVLSMGLSGLLSDLIGAQMVLIIAGAICAAAGAVGLLIPAMRNAR